MLHRRRLRFVESTAAAAAAAAASGSLDPRHSLAFAFPMAATHRDQQRVLQQQQQQPTPQEQQQQPQQSQQRTWITEIEDFVANSSIRGLKRTVFSPTLPLRCFWTAFVLGSSLFAFSQVAFLVEKYLLRETIVQQHKAYGHLEEFPAVSFCVSDPFTDAAARLWDTGRVQSPNNFSAELRRTASRLSRSGQGRLARSLLRLDQRQAYFQNIPDRHLLRQLGHLQPFYFCAINPFDYGHAVFRHYDSATCNISVHFFMHPIHLNCYTLFFNSSLFSRGLKSIFLVLPGGRSEPRYGLGPHENASFLRDTLKKYTTVQVVLHDANKKPNFDETMMLTHHPSMINVMSFTTSKFVNNDCVKVDSPPVEDTSNARHRFNQDDFDACLGKYIEDQVITECGCTEQLESDNGTIGDAAADTPMCFRVHWDNLSLTDSRMKCSLYGGRFLDSFINAAKHCPRPCQSTLYETNLIQSENIASDWQRCWYMGTYMDTAISPRDHARQIDSFLSSDPDDFDPSSCRRPWYSGLPYVMLKIVRQDFTTRMYNETLVLTSTALFAQVGAALAFYLGLTLTFLAEIVDLVLRVMGLLLDKGRGRSGGGRRRSPALKMKPLSLLVASPQQDAEGDCGDDLDGNLCIVNERLDSISEEAGMGPVSEDGQRCPRSVEMRSVGTLTSREDYV